MESSFTPQQTYIEEFSASDYFQTYYVAEGGVLHGEWTEFVLRNLHETFTAGGVKGHTLLDFGAGPTIYHLLSSCEVFDEIITSDFLEQNRAELTKWLTKDPKAFDWTPVIKFVCELEGNRESVEKKAEKLRSTVKEVLKCDVFKRNPYDPVVLQPVDCLLTCLCLEAPCEDIKSFCNVLKNFKDLIKPGGHLLILSVLNSTFYYVGKKYFTSMCAKQEEIEEAFKEAGYEIEKAVYAPRNDKSRMDISDYDGYYYIHAQKPKESIEKKAEKLRSTVKEVLKCDALKRNPYDPVVLQPVDCLLTCLCLEAPCEDIKSFCNVLKNFKDLIKPGGHLLILSVLNSTFYYVGKTYFASMCAKQEELEEAFKEAGYEIEKAVYAPRNDKSRMDISDYDGYYYIHARKPK